MTIKIKRGGSDLLVVEAERGQAKVSVNGNEIRVQGEKVLKEIGLTLSDAIALFFDQAASQQTKARFQT